MKKTLSVPTIAAFTAIAFGAGAADMPNFGGTYQCDASKAGCEVSGQTFTVTQSGDTLDVKNDKGAIGQGKVTSAISISMGPPWNMLGVVLADNRTIEWSNGTQWRKQ